MCVETLHKISINFPVFQLRFYSIFLPSKPSIFTRHIFMLNRKLLEVLKLLNPVAHTRLRHFLQSPYFNHRGNASELLQLYDLIMRYRAEEEHPKLSKLAVSQFFFPEKLYIEGKKGPLDALASDLFGLVKRFMTQVSFDKKDLEFEEGITMARFYRRYGMEERFWQVIQALRKSQQDNPLRDANFFQKQFYIEDEAGAFETLNNRFEDDANVGTAIQHLDIAYAISKMEMLCGLSYQQKLAQFQFDLSIPLHQVVFSLPENYPEVKQHEIYLRVFELIQNPHDEGTLERFETLLSERQSEIPFDKMRNLKAYHRFFMNRRYTNSGSTEVRQQIFEVYKQHFEQGYFYEGADIMINALKMLILFGLRLKQFDWVKTVLDEHPPKRICGTKYPIEAHGLCVAEYHFFLKDYAKALESLVYKQYENPYYSLWAEMLLIKIYYETSDELLEYRMKALDQKVRRTKLSTESKRGYYQFLQKLDKIIKYKWSKNGPKLAKIADEIKTMPGIFDREWLLEKLAEL